MSTAASSTPRKLKILMLHGYTQSGPLFHAKTRALEKLLTKAFPSSPLSPLKSYPGGIQLIYPTAPINLRPADIPGYTSTSDTADGDENVDTDAWAWWKKSDSTGLYQGLDLGLSMISNTIKSVDGIDGVIGFSQGAAAATLVASLLDTDRLSSWNEYVKSNPDALPYPKPFLLNDGEGKVFHPPLKFAISYSGFYAPPPAYKPFYTPKIQTKMLHFIGTLDSVVEEERSLGSAKACIGWGEGEGKKNVVYHPGGHFVPINKEMTGVLIGFIKKVLVNVEKGGKREEEEGVEDMDVPF